MRNRPSCDVTHRQYDNPRRFTVPDNEVLDGVNKKNDVNNTASEAPEKNVKTEF